MTCAECCLASCCSMFLGSALHWEMQHVCLNVFDSAVKKSLFGLSSLPLRVNGQISLTQGPKLQNVLPNSHNFPAQKMGPQALHENSNAELRYHTNFLNHKGWPKWPLIIFQFETKNGRSKSSHYSFFLCC